MKRILLLILATALTTISAVAQKTNTTFAKKDNVLGIGFGIGGVYGFSGFSSQSPAFGLQYDRGIVELGMGGVIGVGGFVGYKGFVNKIETGGDTYKGQWNVLIIGARGTFHYDLFEVKNLDTYAGTMIAFHVVNEKEDYPNNVFVTSTSHSNAAYASIFAGAKYYFSPQVAGFGELGYGVSWLTLGMAFKF
ncbi:MAG: hypothetical protein IPP71_22420 [Bacteroidetes bacterium]|nr:hypothetical protein [Bacteroidota bacterium]